MAATHTTRDDIHIISDATTTDSDKLLLLHAHRLKWLKRRNWTNLRKGGASTGFEEIGILLVRVTCQMMYIAFCISDLEPGVPDDIQLLYIQCYHVMIQLYIKYEGGIYHKDTTMENTNAT